MSVHCPIADLNASRVQLKRDPRGGPLSGSAELFDTFYDHSVRHGRLPVPRRRSIEQPNIAVLAVSIDPIGRACARDTRLGCDVRDRPRLSPLKTAVRRRRYHLCRRSFWNQWCAYGSLLKGSTSTNPDVS